VHAGLHLLVGMLFPLLFAVTVGSAVLVVATQVSKIAWRVLPTADRDDGVLPEALQVNRLLA
jgi:hypothetical protein